MRNRAWRRKKNFSKGRRKKNIVRAVCKNWQFKYDGQYIKGKIHCSCPLCSCKTNNNGRWGVAMNWKHSDAQKIMSMDSQIKEFVEKGKNEI